MPQYLGQIEGRRPVLEALKARPTIHRVRLRDGSRGQTADDIRAWCRRRDIRLDHVSGSRLDSLAQTGTHQGVVAEAEPLQTVGREELLERAREAGGQDAQPPFLVMAAEIQDPRNLGAVVRSAEAVGAHGVIVPKHRSAPLSPALASASAGAVEYLPVAQVTNLTRTVDWLRQEHVWVYGGDAGGRPLFATDMTGPVLVVVGSEGRGIPRLVREHCDQLVSIPLSGQIASLNAGVAAGIIMYEIRRQRDHPPPEDR